MKYILCSEYQKEFIYHDLLSKSNGELGTRLFTLSNLLEKGNELKERTSLIVRHKLLAEKEDFPCYREMFNYPEFMDEVISFAREMLLWNIPVSSLPNTTSREKELQHILSLILEEELAEKGLASTYKDSINKVSSYEEVTSYPLFETNYFNYKVLEEILSQPNIHPVSFKTECKSHERRYALSTRQEIEAVAQDICLQKKPCNIILCSYSDTYPVLKQVFDRYHIPFYAYQEKVCTNIPYIFYTLVMFALQKDNESFITCLKYNAFAYSANDRVINYLNDHPDEYQTIIMSKSLPLLHRDEKKMNAIIDECNDYLDLIRDDVFYLLDSTTPIDALNRAYELMSKLPILEDKKELESALQIYNILSHTLDELRDEEDVIFITKEILQITLQKNVNYSSFCMVTDLTHPVPSKEITYILGCSGRAYPSVPVKKGLFDEAYVASIKEYPSLSERHHAYMEQLDWIHHSASHIIYSYATNDYQGREIQLAFEIKQIDGNNESSWKLVRNQEMENKNHKLSRDIASPLFEDKEHLIHGSISSIERYFSCPYSYFIQSGLNVRDESYTENNNAFIGTVSHSVMENAVKKYGKRYPQISDEEIDTIITPYFEELDVISPTESSIHALTKERLMHSLRVSIDYLQNVEDNTLFKPVHVEEKFDANCFDGIALRGVIDRVDEVNGYFRIIDYKSSEHKLSPASIKAGLQLQLLTYLIVENCGNEYKPLGAYYYNMQTQNTTLPASSGYKMKTGITPIEMNEETYMDAMNETKALKGWALENPSDIDTDYALYHNPNKIYDYDKVKECMDYLYRYFRENLLDGDIKLEPVIGACTFCKYKCICNFSGQLKEAKPIIDEDFKFTKDKTEDESCN